MSLSPENKALMERDFNVEALLYLAGGGHGPMLDRIMDAARAEGRAHPHPDVSSDHIPDAGTKGADGERAGMEAAIGKKFCDACMAFPMHGYCNLAGCPMPRPSPAPSKDSAL